jgi:hypothetical protein
MGTVWTGKNDLTWNILYGRKRERLGNLIMSLWIIYVDAKSPRILLTIKLQSNHHDTSENLRRYYREKSQDGCSIAWAVLPTANKPFTAFM